MAGCGCGGASSERTAAQDDFVARPLGGEGVAESQIAVTLTAPRTRRRQVEPFIGLDVVVMNAVALVVHQAEHGLREPIALNSALAIKVVGNRPAASRVRTGVASGG